MSAANRSTALSRRALLTSAITGVMLTALPVRAKTTYPAFHVVKDPNCGCCGDWIALVEQAGFPVTVEDMPNDALARLKAKAGIPPAMTSCHTARVEGYVIEGHVPLADIRRLLDSRPDAIGLSVPGMPWGSPGMGPEAEREAYDVHLIRKDGTTRIFNHYPAA